MARHRVAVTGAGGRIGRLLQRVWPDVAPKGLEPVFLDRADWDILQNPAPAPISVDAVIDLAGVIRGDTSQNPQIAAAVAAWAVACGAVPVFLSSAAVYPGGPRAMDEETDANPMSDYGRSKFLAEGVVRAADKDALILRLGNLAGADALLGGAKSESEVILTPVPGEAGGPVRSYIGPRTFAFALLHMVEAKLAGRNLPQTINLAQPGTVTMRSLLEAKGQPWRFGEPTANVLARMELSTTRLLGVLDLPPVSADGLVEELVGIGNWP